jgi:hypothetical protein
VFDIHIIVHQQAILFEQTASIRILGYGAVVTYFPVLVTPEDKVSAGPVVGVDMK